MRRRPGTALALLCIVAAGCGGGGGYSAGVGGLPVAPAGDRRIEPDDVLSIMVLDAPELTRTVRVSAGGVLTMPLLGEVMAGGLTTRELATQLGDLLRGKYMVDPQVTVELTEMRSRSVYVLGSVNQPGAYPLEGTGNITVLRALALGEGLTGTAAKGDARIIRGTATGQRIEIPVDLGRVLDGTAADVPMEPDDVLFVPSSSARSFARAAWEAIVRVVTLRGVF